MPIRCRHCDDEVENHTCRLCRAYLPDVQQCLTCHLELAHNRVVPKAIDVRDPKTSLVDNGPFLPRPTKGFDEPTSVHEGKSGESLADGWAMLEGYENADDKYRSNQKLNKLDRTRPRGES